MKSQHSISKWVSFSVLLLIFLNSIFTSPLAHAQGEVTPTPTATEIEGFLAPTPTLTLPSIEENPELQELEEPFSSFQSLQEFSSSLESIWPAFNISDTDLISSDASVAVDSNGHIHFAWTEHELGIQPEVFYAFWDGDYHFFDGKQFSEPIRCKFSLDSYHKINIDKTRMDDVLQISKYKIQGRLII
jgi:hypothetical protein